ncbi:MAG TPA: RluA family pseudouridine synthase [Bacillota bacterium]|jgi:23S rRNA pseudouridine1911/1915/1917 synthase|nr:RluA family pseudouridine synthase [Bacillota bacterium]
MGMIVSSPAHADAGLRLDVYLAKEQVAPSRSFIQRLIEDGAVRVNGRVEIKPSYRVRASDVIEVSLPPPEDVSACVPPEDIAIAVLYEDDDLLVVDKPRGMTVHPGAGRTTGTLVNALLGRQMNLSGIGGPLRPGIVHRLDRNTTGVMIVAKTDQAHLRLAADLAAHRVGRHYLALVRGNIVENEGVVDAPIGRHAVDRKRQAVVVGGRRAVTHFRTLERFGDYTLIEATLETGRTHQIRVHMQYIGRPVAGDPVYGGVRDELGLAAQALHSAKVEFTHPATGRHMVFVADMPDDMRAAVGALRDRTRGRMAGK